MSKVSNSLLNNRSKAVSKFSKVLFTAFMQQVYSVMLFMLLMLEV